MDSIHALLKGPVMSRAFEDTKHFPMEHSLQGEWGGAATEKNPGTPSEGGQGITYHGAVPGRLTHSSLFHPGPPCPALSACGPNTAMPVLVQTVS